jgi:hypothetical protein
MAAFAAICAVRAVRRGRTCQPSRAAHRFRLRPTSRSPLAPMANDPAVVRIPSAFAVVTRKGCWARSSFARVRADSPGVLRARSSHRESRTIRWVSSGPLSTAGAGCAADRCGGCAGGRGSGARSCHLVSGPAGCWAGSTIAAAGRATSANCPSCTRRWHSARTADQKSSAIAGWWCRSARIAYRRRCG